MDEWAVGNLGVHVSNALCVHDTLPHYMEEAPEDNISINLPTPHANTRQSAGIPRRSKRHLSNGTFCLSLMALRRDEGWLEEGGRGGGHEIRYLMSAVLLSDIPPSLVCKGK